MAPELRPRKPKATSEKASGKEVKDVPPTAPKEKVTKQAKGEKRRAAEDAAPTPPKKQKSGALATIEKRPAEDEPVKPKPKKTKAVKEPVETTDEPEKEAANEEEAQAEPAEEVAASDEDEVDGETQALVQTLDSGDEADAAPAPVLQKGQKLGKVPKISSKVKKALQEAGPSEETGVIYMGRLPHGFAEHELRGYLSQFGPVTRLRISRNKKTGASKHWAFIEFAEDSTADVVAKTMNNYLLYGHLLKCSKVPKAQVHANLFAGSNRRFKKVPWNKMAGNQLDRPKSESMWAATISKEEQKRTSRAEKLKALGYEFESPKLKAAEAKVTAALENGDAEVPKAIEDAPAAPVVAPVAEANGQPDGEAEQKESPAPNKKAKAAATKKEKTAGKKKSAKAKQS